MPDSSVAAGKLPRRRRVFRRAAAIAIGLVFALVLALAGLHSSPARRYVLSLLLSWAAKQNIGLDIARLDYNLPGLSVTLGDLTIRRPDTPDLPPIAQIERVTIRARLSALLRGRYVIESGEIIRPTVKVVTDKNGRNNVPRPPKKSTEPARPVEYMIRNLVVREGQFVFDDRRRQLDIQLPLQKITIEGVGMRRHVVGFSAIDGHLALRGRHVSIGRARADVILEPDRIGLRQFDLDSAEGTISASATLTELNDPRYDISLAATLDAARITTLLGFGEPILGSVQAHISARGPLSGMVVSGRVEGRNLGFRNIRDMALDASLTYEAAARHARVDRLSIRGPAGRIDADGAVALDPRGRLSHLRARLADIDGEILSQALRLPIVVGTRASGSIDLQWPRLDTASATGEADLSLVASGTGKPSGTVPLAGHLAATSRAGTAVLEISSVQSLGATIDGRVSLADRRTVDGHLTACGNDVGHMVSAIESIFTQKKISPVKVSGPASVDLRLAGTLDAPTARLDLSAPELTIGQSPGFSASVRADYADSGVSIDHAGIKWNDGHLSASGRIGMRARQELMLDLVGENADVADVLAILNHSEVPVSGTMSFAGHVSGTVSNPIGNFSLQATGLQAYSETLGTLSADAALENREVHLTGTAEKFQLSIDARVAARDPYPASLEISTTGFDLAALTSLRSRSLTGLVTGHVTASGDLRHLRAASASATIDKISATWNGNPIETEGPVTASYKDERVTIDRIAVRAAGSTATVMGTLPLESRPQQASLQIESHLDLASLARYVPVQRTVTGAGNLTVSGSIRGSLKAIDPDVVIDSENAAISVGGFEPGLSDLHTRLRIAAGKLRIEQLDAGWGTARLRVSGEIPFGIVPVGLPLAKAQGPAKLQIDVAKLDVSTLPGIPGAVGGLISLHAQAEAPRADLRAVTGRVTFSDLGIRFNDLTLDQQGETAIAIAGGSANFERLQLGGSAGRLSVAGEIGFVGNRKLDVVAGGEINVAAMNSFLPQMAIEGTTTVQLSAQGSMSAPHVGGFLELKDGNFRIDTPPLSARELDLRLDVGSDRATLTRLSGIVNGGTLTGSGSALLGGPNRVKDVDLRISLEEVALDEPFDLRTISDADISIAMHGDRFDLCGKVMIREGGLTEDIDLDSTLFAAMTARRVLDLTKVRNRLLERVALNVSVATASPIVVDNNLGRAELTADLRVVGTPYETGLTGRLSIEEGSELTLNDHRYEVERGNITFLEERRIAPSLDLAFSTTARNYDIAIVVTGTPGHTDTTLSSDPVLPEPDIMSLLVTGRTLEEMRGAELEVAKAQALSHLGGRIGSSFGRRIERVTGLSTVQIEPSLVANETNPSARLTLGQDIARSLKLIYSTDLRNSSDQIWVAEYDVTRRFVSRAVRQSDGSYRFDVRHDLKLGGGPEQQHTPRRQRQIVATVEVDGNAGVGAEEILKRFGIKQGREYDFFATRRGLDRVTELYVARGWLESRIKLERQSADGSVSLALHIVPGPKVDLLVEGVSPPKNLHKKLILTWNRGAYDAQRISDLESALKSWLVENHHVAPIFEHKVESVETAAKRVVVRVEPGPRLDHVSIEFPGAKEIKAAALNKIIVDQKLKSRVFTAPDQVTDLLARFYREEGFLAAAMTTPEYDLRAQTGTARVLMPVHEGPRFLIRQMTVVGNGALPTETLLSEIPLVSGKPFLPAVADRSLTRIRELYWQRGYTDVDLDYQLTLDPPAGYVDVRLLIKEGRRSVVTEIAVTGNQETSSRLVLGEVGLQRGAPLDLQSLGSSRKNLYRTGAFSRVEITREEIDPESVSVAPGAEKPERVTVNVQEVPPFQIRYGALYDTERGLGGIIDVSNHNSLGEARVFGLRTRYDSQLQEGRVYFSQPALHRFPSETIVAIYRGQEHHPSLGGITEYSIDRTGFSIQQEKRAGSAYVWTYGFRLEHAITSSPTPDPVLNTDIRVAPLSCTLIRDTRDNPLDAAQGSFLTHALELSPRQLGSSVTFVKYFGQYFRYLPLTKPEHRPFTGEIPRPRLVFATGVRLGLSHAFGDARAVPLSEHFLAGGSTTVRGFEQDGLGPKGLGGEPLGGAAMFILNNELRFPVLGPLNGVVFLDVGNVFPAIKDFSFSDLREVAGFGLRIHVRSILLRLDSGFLLNRHPGDSASRVFFSIGQAF
ncbi:MAG: translocation/assembly module TamB domain-containing protein [Acidobacteria bacterium]|nr:translocation/assembly module TamB domain-containing protein [Acidobacteriota bacterium]